MPPRINRNGFQDFNRVPTPTNPQIESSGQRDPRGFGQGYSPLEQWDELTLTELRKHIADGIVPIQQILDYLDANNLPPQLVQGSYLQQITQVGKPVLLVPKNVRRQGIIISNFNTAGATGVVFSFDQPLQTGLTSFAGLPLDMRTFYEESNGSVTINDIWVTCNDAAAVYPFFILAYEGTLSIAGNKK